MLDDSLKRAKQKTVGLKQTLRAIEKGQARQVYIAQDAEQHVSRPIAELCQKRNVPLIMVDSMAELGKACGIEVGAAVAAITAE